MPAAGVPVTSAANAAPVSLGHCRIQDRSVSGWSHASMAGEHVPRREGAAPSRGRRTRAGGLAPRLRPGPRLALVPAQLPQPRLHDAVLSEHVPERGSIILLAREVQQAGHRIRRLRPRQRVQHPHGREQLVRVVAATQQRHERERPGLAAFERDAGSRSIVGARRDRAPTGTPGGGTTPAPPARDEAPNRPVGSAREARPPRRPRRGRRVQARRRKGGGSAPGARRAP
jgi:hypothetical protein